MPTEDISPDGRLFATDLLGFGYLSVLYTKEIRQLLPSTKEMGSTIYGAPTMCQAPCWGCLNAAKSSIIFLLKTVPFSLCSWPSIDSLLHHVSPCLCVQLQGWGGISVSSAHLSGTLCTCTGCSIRSVFYRGLSHYSLCSLLPHF